MKYLFIFLITFGILFEVIGICNRTTETVVVTRTQMEQNISTTDGNTHSENVFKVYTNKRVYEVEQKGFYAHPEYIGMIEKGDTLVIESVMYDMPFFGMYKVIDNIKSISR